MSQLLAFVRLAANLFRKPVTVDEAYGFLPDTYRGMPARDDEKCTDSSNCCNSWARPTKAGSVSVGRRS